MKPNSTARTLLTDLGVGNFNATMIIQFMFMAPAATDPRSPPILMLVRHIQRALYAMGAQVNETGFLDQATAAELARLAGPQWLNMPWSQIVKQVNDAKASHVSLAPAGANVEAYGPQAVGGVFDFLPDVPGGMLTYAVGGLVAYHFWTKRKRKGAS